MVNRVSTALNGEGVEEVSNNGPNAAGVYGASSTGFGVLGTTNAANGAGVWAVGGGVSGTALRIESGGIKVAGAGLNTATPVFIHTATLTNVTGNCTIIDHPLTNGDPNAILIVTPNYNPGGVAGAYNSSANGVFYTAGKWTIFNKDNTGMPMNASFNVLAMCWQCAGDKALSRWGVKGVTVKR